MTDHDTGGTLDGWDDELNDWTDARECDCRTCTAVDWQAEADRLTAERRRQQTAYAIALDIEFLAPIFARAAKAQS